MVEVWWRWKKQTGTPTVVQRGSGNPNGESCGEGYVRNPKLPAEE
jgi:hypothetical protein